MSAILDKPKIISPSFPRKPPMKNLTSFENPEPRCRAFLCPSFSLPSCVYCKLHCQKFHNGKHIDKIELDNIMDCPVETKKEE